MHASYLINPHATPKCVLTSLTTLMSYDFVRLPFNIIFIYCNSEDLLLSRKSNLTQEFQKLNLEMCCPYYSFTCSLNKDHFFS